MGKCLVKEKNAVLVYLDYDRKNIRTSRDCFAEFEKKKQLGSVIKPEATCPRVRFGKSIFLKGTFKLGISLDFCEKKNSRIVKNAFFVSRRTSVENLVSSLCPGKLETKL